jgi:hypothetical protein
MKILKILNNQILSTKYFNLSTNSLEQFSLFKVFFIGGWHPKIFTIILEGDLCKGNDFNQY